MANENFFSIICAWVLQDFPESLAMALFVCSVLNLHLRDRRIFMVALAQSITNLVRLLPVAFGMHSVLLIISLAIYTRLFMKAQLSRVFLAVLICSAVMVATELTYTKPLLSFTGLAYDEAFANPFLRAAFALPMEIVLLLLALVKNRYNQKRGLAC